MKVISTKVCWEDDCCMDTLEYLSTTPEEHYGTEGANWAHVSEEDRAKVIAEHGSVWNACVEYARQDAVRLAAWEAGEWCLTGCFAIAQVQSPTGTRQKIRTSGLWGIESDIDSDYRHEIETEQLAELYLELKSFGIIEEN